MPKKTGRPSKYTEELAAEICARIAGGESLVGICNDAHMPHRDTVRDWLVHKPDFSGRYARAREEQADYYADEMIRIADTAEDPAKARVQIDTRKWISSKLKPKKYGDKIDHSHEGDLNITVKKVISSARDND